MNKIMLVNPCGLELQNALILSGLKKNFVLVLYFDYTFIMHLFVMP
jgi:hypothetical protein